MTTETDSQEEITMSRQVCEQMIGSDATRGQAEGVIRALRAMGHDVVYGTDQLKERLRGVEDPYTDEEWDEAVRQACA